MTTRSPARLRTGLDRPLALLVAGTFFMENLDGTVLATAAPAIARDLGVAPVDVNLAMTVYLVAIAAGLPISGWLTDRFGGRRILTVAIAIFTVASALCALSANLPELVGARIVQGIGGALMVPVGRLVVIRVTAKAEMLAAIAYLTWPALLAPVIAPALGGWIVSVASWHWIFLINLPLGLLALVVAARIVPRERSQVGPLDWFGFAICAGFLGSLLIGIELIRPGAGTGWHRLVAAAAATVVSAAMGSWWFRQAAHPLLRFDALHHQSFRVSNVGGSAYRMIINAVPFLLPLMFQVGFGWSPVLAGTLVLLLFVGNVVIKPATSPLIRRFGFRIVLIGSVLGGALMLGGIALLRPSTPFAVIGGVLVLSGVFRSVGFTAYNSLQFADIDVGDLTDANTLGATIQQVATGLGVAVGALLLRSAEQIVGAGGVAPFALAFVVLALLMLWPLLEAVLLHRSAGNEIAGR